jgi:hypothetical protein
VSTSWKRPTSLGVGLSLVISLAGGSGVAAGSGDISATAEGRSLIGSTATRFSAGGHPTSAGELSAIRLADGDVLVVRRDVSVIDRSKTGDGVSVKISSPTGRGGTSTTKSGLSAQATASASWSLVGDNCFGSLFRSTAHFDACYRMYKMASDGVAGKEYWRLDFYGTMFAEGKKLRWGWLAADQDAGPAQSWTDWSPDADTSGNCQSTSVGISVLGVGASYGYTQCETWDISKSSGTTLGYFKNYWTWGNSLPLLDRDRGLAMMIGTKGNDGWPVYGLSWDFAIY